MNQALTARELIVFANQILVRDSQLPGSPSIADLAMGKHAQWLNLPHSCTYNDIITRAKEIVADKELLQMSIIENSNNVSNMKYRL